MTVDAPASEVSERRTGRDYTWRDQSVCRDHPTRWWFAGGHRDAIMAKSICAGCLVQGPCLEFALSRPDLLGIWAATTPSERAALRRSVRDSAPDVGTDVDLVTAERAEEDRDCARPTVPQAEPTRPGHVRYPTAHVRGGAGYTAHGDADLLTPAEAARKLGVTANTVTRWSRAGKLSAIQTMGGHRRFRRSEIERVLGGANVASSSCSTGAS